MATSLLPTIAASPVPPFPSKRGQGAIGSDLVVTYHSDLAQCEILPAGSRYTSAGNLKAGTFLAFNPPPLSTICTHNCLASTTTSAPACRSCSRASTPMCGRRRWRNTGRGRWFTITARVCPNQLSFQSVSLDGWDLEDGAGPKTVRVALALPRDGANRSIVPRLLHGRIEGAAWPTSPAHASFAGSVDHDTFRLREDIWTEALTKSSAFVKLGAYLLPENDRPPHKGVHVCHVLVLFPVDRQPWSSQLAWMRQSSNPFPRGSWIACTGGRVLGVLNRNLLRSPPGVDASLRILVVLADDWEFIRQDSLSTQNASTPAPSTAASDSPTRPRPVGPGGVASRNPFSSTTHATKAPPAIVSTSPSFAIPPPPAPATTLDQPPAPAPGRKEDDGRPAAVLNLEKAEAEAGLPEPSTPTRAKRTTAGKKRPSLHE
ncbi:uncharacterized protein PG998_014547 [Apiospora kogelbergensis]|uniref:uncharacterized protein n=1 Tax=Apiospora kogelbergensis TaxID=1337665 RepID=UPI00312F725B